MTIARVLAFAFAVCFAGAVHAQPVIQGSIVGSGCVPTDATIKFNRHIVNNASVQHAATNVDQIVLTCPIARFNVGTADWVLRLIYQDSTGTTAPAYVRARLYRMEIDPPTGNPMLMATATSNSSAVTTINAVESAPFNHTFDFTDSIYWIRIEMDRAATNQTVIFHGAHLQEVPAPSDLRLKHNIVLLGHLANGVGFYRFSYNGSDKAYVGVMAQEVEAIMPDTVVRGTDGYLRVYYNRLGFQMQSWEDWVAGGEKIPTRDH